MIMDQYLSEVIIAVITGIFSVVTILIRRNQNNIIDKIDSQALFIEKEKMLKQKLAKKYSEQESIINQILLLTLETNLSILKNTTNTDASDLDDSVYEKSQKLKNDFNKISSDIIEITKEYEMILNLSNDLHQKSGVRNREK